MAYRLIVKAVQVTYRRTAAPLAVQTVRFVLREVRVPPGVSCLHRGAHSGPEDRSVSKFQSGSPKPSAAQKGDVSLN